MNTPKIRFKGFSGDWEQRKLGDLVTIGDIDHRMPKTVENGIPYLMTGDFCGLNDLNFDGVKQVSEDDYEQLSRKIKPEKGDILFARYASVGAVRYVDFDDRFLISYSCAIIKGGENINSKYLYHYLTGEVAQKQIGLEINTGSQANIGIDSMKNNIIVTMPSDDEQKNLANLLDNLDNLITLHQRKCDNLKQVKKYMLQKMFPKQGEKVPEIRFAGFTGDWEQRKFSELAKTKRGLTYKPENIVSEGKRVLRSSNINEDTFEIHEDDVFVDENSVNIPYVKNGDILITSANGSSRLVGKHAIVRNIIDDSMVHGGFMLLASSDEPEFVNALMSSQWYTKFISIYVAGGNGAIGNLNKNDLDGQVVLVPSKNEMKKIGEYFRNLDNLITLHQRKSDNLKEIKKFMLQNMFPNK